MDATDLPEGASAGTQDTDFSPGRVFTRGGTVGQFTFAGLFSEKLAGFVQSLPGVNAPNEAPWLAPMNATLNIPGVYTGVTLNVTAGSTGGGSGISFFDHAVTSAGTSATITNSGSPSSGGEIVLAVASAAKAGLGGVSGPSPGVGWTALDATANGVFGSLYAKFLPDTSLVSVSEPLNLSGDWASILAFVGSSTGLIPTVIQNTPIISGSFAPGTYAVPFGINPTTGNAILVAVYCNNVVTTISSCTVTDSVGNTYQQLGSVTQPAGANGAQAILFMASSIIGGGPVTITVHVNNGSVSGSVDAYELAGFGAVATTGPYSQVLQSNNFHFSVPATVGVLGIQAEVSGHQSTLSPDAILTAQLVQVNGSLSPATLAFQLPLVDAQVVEGAANFSWSIPITPALVNNPNFSLNLVATALGGELASFNIYAVKLKAWLSPSPACNFNWVKTYEQTDAEIDTLALDANGILWDENATSAPGVLNGIATNIAPGSYAKSVTFDDVEYIGISDLTQGTDVPRLWNGQWLDRVSQVGPGAPPSFGTTASGANILSITQNAPIALLVGPHDFLLVSASPAAHGTFGTPATPGNVMSIFPRFAFTPPAYIKAGSNIQISGFPLINGSNVNNDPAGVFNPAYYTVTSVGAPIPGQLSYPWITFQIPFTTFYNQPVPPGCTIQATVATLTASQQVPFLEVGNQFTLSGVIPTGWNNTFVVQATPNASQLAVSQTSLTANTANYVFTIITGVAPTVGEFVTVTGTLNGGGIFNVTNAVITAASPTQFSISLVGPNVSATAETGNGIISGTIFQFDPAGTVTNPIIGNAGPGGTISTSGVIGVGTRQGVVIFMTRDVALTAPSPPVSFNVTLTASAIVASSIPIGPPNVTQRILAFTGAGGANFFYIPEPVTVTTNGQQVTYPATVVNDNTTTQITLSFPDAVLLAASAIDIAGNNLFEQEELGSCVGFLTYSDRLIAWGEQNKIQNLLNLSFDGGIGTLSAQQQATLQNVGTYPLGWVVDIVNGSGSSLLVSPIFGNSYYIHNTSGGLQAIYGMIEQGAYQDAFQVPIVTTGTLYSVRVAARSPSGAVSGNLVMDLFSPKQNQVYGSFSVPLSSMTTVMKIFTGTLLTAPFAVVPKDLLFRVYATNIPNNGDVELDRVEPFPTLEPSFSTEFTASYVANPEAFDLVTGHFGPSQNQQPIRGGMVLFDTLYALKTKSWYSTSDNGTTEPNFWNWREVSNKIGTIGSHSYDYGEDWAFTACRAGVYFFSGGEPLKVSQEIAPVWDLVNWAAAQSIWVRNDSEQRRLYVGVPIATPNIFMPEFPINTNPQTPNVILMMNYRELNSGLAVADTPPIRSSFSGRLLAPEPARKWSFWNLQSPYADFIDRGNNTTPLFLCNGVANSKIYQVVTTELDDDGAPINSYYLSYGFCKSDLQDAKGLGKRRMLLGYLGFTAEGNGSMNVSIYAQSPENLPFLLTSIPLSQFTLGDLEAVANVVGDRFFIRVGTNAVGASFQLSKIIASLSKDAWSQIRGSATANA